MMRLLLLLVFLFSLIEGSKVQVQKPAPQFSLTGVVNKEFAKVSLDDFKGKYLVLLFYPLDFTFVCPTELIAFSDRAAEFRSHNAQVVAVSVDSEHTHLAWINTPRSKGGVGDMQIPLLADITKQVSQDYGVLIPEQGISLRGLFIIDGNGVVRQVTINDLPVGRSVDETLRLIQAFQFTDANGEVCPANWKPGQRTMKPDPNNSKAYFEQVFSA